MVTVIVEHFLTQEGQIGFSDWVDYVRSLAVKFDGLVDVTRVYDIKRPTKTIIQLRWESEQALDNWRAAHAHDDILARIKPLSTRPANAYFLDLHGPQQHRPPGPQDI